MNRTGLFFFLSLIIALFWTVPGSFGQESEANQAQLKKYMETYKNYLKAKINNDPAADERLKEYNQAYSEYIKFLRISIPQRKTTDHPEPSKTVSVSTIGSDNAPIATLSQNPDHPAGTIASETASSPNIPIETATTTITPTASEPISIPASEPSLTTP